jgi:hypothetical protein
MTWEFTRIRLDAELFDRQPAGAASARDQDRITGSLEALYRFVTKNRTR